MSTASAELGELRISLRKSLRTPAIDVIPDPGPAWRQHWPELARLGITALCVAEDAGGFGLEVPAAVVTARELGAVLHGSPFAATSAALFAIPRWLDAAYRSAALETLVSGAEVATLAILEPGGTVIDGPHGPLVEGRARLVAGAADADAFVVVVPDGETMVLVRRGATCTAQLTHAFDVSRSCADLLFERAPGLLLRCGGAGRAATERIHNLLTAADALGGVERSLERAIAYSRDRTAFGRPIGGFQAVQHRLVDHTLRVRGLSLLVAAAAQDLANDGGERTTLLAEAAVARHAVHILHDLLQLTGAIGFTWEYGLHLYERRAHLDARLARNPRGALRAIAVAEGWQAAG